MKELQEVITLRNISGGTHCYCFGFFNNPLLEANNKKIMVLNHADLMSNKTTDCYGKCNI